MTTAGTTYGFEDEFQTEIVHLVVRDAEFNARAEGLIKPDYFTNEAEATLVNIAQRYYADFKTCPSMAAVAQEVRAGLNNKSIRNDLLDDLKRTIAYVFKNPVPDREYALRQVATFARHRAVEAAILESAEQLDKGNFDKIERAIKQALEVGINETKLGVSFFSNAEARAAHRADVLAGRIPKTGVTTGYDKLDKLLYHGGWGRRELTLFMAPAKGGKSMTLVQFAANALIAKYNVLYVTLEVSQAVIEDRFDACLTGTEMNSLLPSAGVVRDRVDALAVRSGHLEIVEFFSGKMTPADLSKLLRRYEAKGRVFDMVCVDYADLMSPNRVFDDARENSRLVYVDLRAIAQEHNLALLTATQSNREGFKAAVGKMEHVAEDINKVRTTDLMISINATDDEKARGEARLFFAASRNQKGNITVKVKGAMSKAQMIQQITAIEE